MLEGGPQRLPAAKRVVEDQVVEAVRPALTGSVEPVDLAVAGVLARGEIVLEHVQGGRGEWTFRRTCKRLATTPYASLILSA